MSWGLCCIVFDIDGMFEFFMNFLNIEKNQYMRFMLFPTLKKKMVLINNKNWGGGV